MGSKKNSGIATARTATEALKGKKARISTTTTGGGQGAETAARLISHEEIMRIHNEKKPRGQ